MSQGNACASIGNANTVKIPMIGGYHQNEAAPSPAADGPYIGVNAISKWTYNPANEDFAATGGFTVPATSGAAEGKVARLVSTGASPMTVAADGLCSVSAAGVVTATPTTGLYKTYIAAGTVIPAGAFLWVFLV
jgi:phage baseplate assembly protein gpV